MKKLLGLLAMMSLALTAGELTGKWGGKFEMTNPDGETRAESAILNLKADGTKVTGTIGPNEDKQWDIQSGKLDEGKLTFKVEMEDGGSIQFELVFDGETIRGDAKGTGHNGEKMSVKLDLKRTT
jgi:hypothetical protein